MWNNIYSYETLNKQTKSLCGISLLTNADYFSKKGETGRILLPLLKPIIFLLPLILSAVARFYGSYQKLFLEAPQHIQFFLDIYKVL